MLFQKRVVLTTFDICVSIDYCLDIDNECIFLPYEPKLKLFRSSTYLIQMGKARYDI